MQTGELVQKSSDDFGTMAEASEHVAGAPHEWTPHDALLPGRVFDRDSIRVNTIVKRYPDGSVRAMASDRRIFRIPGYEATERRDPRRQSKAKPAKIPVSDEDEYASLEALAIAGDGGLAPVEVARNEANMARARRRAVAAVRDFALANSFKYFVTLTFDRQKVDRWNDKEVMRVTMNWLDNHVRRDGLAYVLVPERHKDGAIHFHGFFNGALHGTDSGHKTTRGQTVYNLDAWPWGFTTAIEVYGEYGAAVGYVCKYVTKGAEKVGGRWYYHGGDLQRPSVEYINTNWEEVSNNLDTKTIDALGASIVFLEAEGG